MDEAEQTNAGSPLIYREELPDDCPPADAIEITEELIAYRLVKSNPPTSEDFRSLRDLKPNRSFGDLPECQIRGLSVHFDKTDSENLLKLPNLQNCHLCRLKLNAGAGKIKQTNKLSHHTWWPFADYDILSNCLTQIG